MSTHSRVEQEASRLQQKGQRLVQNPTISPLIEGLMRLGYIVRGLVYGVIGVLALEVAMGIGGSLDDPQGAIATMGKTTLGKVVLYGILIGLIGYALWGLIRAVFDPLQKGHDAKGLVQRAGYLVSGISYGLLALATYGLITGAASAAHNGQQAATTQQTAATILSQPWGVWAVAIAGLAVIGSGLFQIMLSVSPDFESQFQPYALTNYRRTWVIQSGRFGTAARGVVFTLVGLFLFIAAYRHDPKQAQGIDGVLAALLHQPAGPILLGLVAVGLIGFGIYSAVTGIVLRIRR
jgi:hypothetical protein